MPQQNMIARAKALGLTPVKRALCLYGYVNDVFITLSSRDGRAYTLRIELERAQADADTADSPQIALADGDRARQARDILLSAGTGFEPQVCVAEGRMFATLSLPGDKKGMAALDALTQSALPALQSAGFGGKRVCAQCGGEIFAGDEAYLYDGTTVLPMHSSCCDARVRETQLAAREESDRAHAGRGALGAFLGAAAGAALYFGIGMLGYVASIVGLATGFLCDWGYRKLGGKPGRKKLFALIAALLFSVALGQTALYAWNISRLYDDSGYREEGVSRGAYTLQLGKSFMLGDPDGYLSWQYDALLKNIPLSQRSDVKSREEFIAEYRTDEMVTDFASYRADFIKGLLTGLLYTALGGAAFIVRASKNEKYRAVRV